MVNYNWSKYSKDFGFICLILLILQSCATEERKETLFEKLSPETTDITFENTISDKSRSTFAEFSFIFNRGGVAIGDSKQRWIARFLSGRKPAQNTPGYSKSGCRKRNMAQK